MKTKKLIELLQKADPTGEEEVVCDNIDIYWVDNMPAYWDGKPQILIRENDKIVGGKYKTEGRKVQIHTITFEDLIWDRNITIDYSELDEDMQVSCKKKHQELMEKAVALDYELDLENFTKWVKIQALPLLDDDEEELKTASKTFYDSNLKPKDKIDDDIPVLMESHNSRKHKQWDRNIKVSYTEQGFLIERKVKNG